MRLRLGCSRSLLRVGAPPPFDFQLVVLLPVQTDWANGKGQTAWEFLFSLQMRIVLASILTALIAELIDTKVYQL
jgi:uncharacterized PurR-regulated membrane protein YhhQ (DUF165 family)